MQENLRYEKAITRNLYELAHALLELKVLNTFNNFTETNEIYVQGESVFSISNRALFNDMLGHAIKILEVDLKGESASFWYIFNYDTLKIKKLTLYLEEKIETLSILAKKLKHIRDKTHFHIDKVGLLDTHKIWRDAGIKGKELSEALQYLFNLLNELHLSLFKKSFLFQPEDYNAEDVIKLLRLAGEKEIIEIYPRGGKEESI